jgi:iodotyrosine deiodinase
MDPIAGPATIPLSEWQELPPGEMLRRANEFRRELVRRRSVRAFSPRPVPRELIEACILGAASAPSGANCQPWHFVAVGSPALKRTIREAAEEEERGFYGGRAPTSWLDALAPLGTDARKPFLETAPWLIAIFAETRGVEPDGSARKNYYVTESVGIATGMLITSLHHAGLVTLTHTPSPMRFLNRILGRPERERPFLLLVVGYPADGVRVPDIRRKSAGEVLTVMDGG